jgi:hypothetical protein
MNMYNMEISIGSYKCRLEICVLIVVLFWIMFGHVLCSCCTMSMQEGMETMKKIKTEAFGEKFMMGPLARRRANYLYNRNNSYEGFESGDQEMDKEMDKDDKRKKGDVMASEDITAGSMKKEGFVGSNNKAYGPEFESSKAPGYIMNPATWAMPTLTYSKGTTPSAGAQSILNRPKQPIPLPEGQLDMFATTKFDGSCCPNAFSTSMGCACMTPEQLGYLHNRGGNNVPYSEY